MSLATILSRWGTSPLMPPGLEQVWVNAAIEAGESDFDKGVITPNHQQPPATASNVQLFDLLLNSYISKCAEI